MVTRDDVIRMAREAAHSDDARILGCAITDLEKFAHLIASHVAEECALACVEVRKGGNGTPKDFEDDHLNGHIDGCNECEWAIRSLYKTTASD